MLGIIGGTGLYALEGITMIDEHQPHTPFGAASAPLIEARYNDHPLVFLPRHGRNHELMPHEINYRANIWALKSLGVKQVISVSAVGSLHESIHPGDLVLPSQYFDFVKGPREKSFFGNGLVAHVSMAESTCAALRQAIVKVAKSMNLRIHDDKNYACIDGPRLGSKLESRFLRDAARCDLVGMTNVPEVFLAREAQICYCCIAVVTDYDCWHEDPAEQVTVEMVVSRYGKSITQVISLLKTFLQNPLPPIDNDYRKCLRHALLTPEKYLNETQKEIFTMLKR